MSNEAETAPGAVVYRRLLGYALPAHWKLFSLAVFCMALSAATETGFAALMQPLLDGSFVERDPQIIRWVPLLLIALFLLRGIADFATKYGMSWIGRSVVKQLREELFRRFLTVPTAYYDQVSSGELMSKMAYHTEQVAASATTVVTTLIRDILTMLALLAWMFYISAVLTLVILVTAPLVALVVSRVSRRFRQLSRNIQTSVGDLGRLSGEVIDGHRVVRIFGGETDETERFERANHYNRRQHMKKIVTESVSVPLVQVIVGLAFAVIVYAATLPSVLETITVGAFVSFMTAMILLLTPVRRLINLNAELQKGIAAAESLFALLDQPGEPDHGQREIERARGAIAFRDVGFAYDAAKGDVLHGIELEIAPGETVAFVGRSGGGKSTLLKLLPRFYEVASGVIELDGIDIRELTLRSLRRQIALVSQDVTLFNATIAENVAYGGRRDADRNEVVAALRAAHAMPFIEQMPEGVDTVVGENGVMLSGGQRQRIAIARALLKDAPILILDEATSALDTESERHVQAALETLMQGRTTLVIAHRLSTVERADRIVALDGGRIVESGNHSELLARDGYYASLYRMQFEEPTAS